MVNLNSVFGYGISIGNKKLGGFG